MGVTYLKISETALKTYLALLKKCLVGGKMFNPSTVFFFACIFDFLPAIQKFRTGFPNLGIAGF
jgi:hypothetical protein